MDKFAIVCLHTSSPFYILTNLHFPFIFVALQCLLSLIALLEPLFSTHILSSLNTTDILQKVSVLLLTKQETVSIQFEVGG